MQISTIRIFGLLALSSLSVAWGQQELRLEVSTGDGVFNDVKASEIGAVSVTVRDSSGRPVKGVAVMFTLPFSGAGADFPDGNRSQTVMSDDKGVAQMPPAKPNSEEGRFNIKASAVTGSGRPATVVISQSNTTALTTQRKSGKTWLFVALAGGGAAAAAVAVLSGGGSSSPTGPGAPPVSTSLSTGVLTVGPPR